MIENFGMQVFCGRTNWYQDMASILTVLHYTLLGLTHSQFALFCHERQHQLGFGFWGDTNNWVGLKFIQHRAAEIVALAQLFWSNQGPIEQYFVSSSKPSHSPCSSSAVCLECRRSTPSQRVAATAAKTRATAAM